MPEPTSDPPTEPRRMPVMKMDLKTVGVIVGLMVSFSTAAGGYAVLHYRVNKLEQLQAKEDQEVIDKIGELKCYVADLHEATLPGC